MVRLIIIDNEAQSEAARALVEDGDIMIGMGVLIECEWVLRSSYGLNRDQICAALRGLLRLKNIHIADRAGSTWALDRFEVGADFADMIHLLEARDADSFATFEQALRLDAGEGSPVRVELVTASAAPISDN